MDLFGISFLGLNVVPIILVIAGLVALRMFFNLNTLAWMAAWWVGLYLMLSNGITVPLPGSIVGMFMGIITLALLVYLTTSGEDLEATKDFMVKFFTDSRYSPALLAFLVLLPSLVAYNVYTGMTQQPQAPVFGRTIHPPPPTDITFKGKKIDLVNDDNPYRILKETDPDAFAAHVANGRKVYYQNCVNCHGDDMGGNGMFAHAFDPIPASFKDPTTIAMLQESYLFWRIAKGAPGLPDESTPWSSAMPAWEKFLSEEDIWDVIIFLYEYTGYEPRAKEELH